MEVIGIDKIEKFEPFVRINKIDISHRNMKILFDFDMDKIAICKDIGIENFSVSVVDEIEAILANMAGAKYIFPLDKCDEIIKLANDYLFDTKIAMICNNRDEFMKAINMRFDTAVFKNAIKDS